MNLFYRKTPNENTEKIRAGLIVNQIPTKRGDESVIRYVIEHLRLQKVTSTTLWCKDGQHIF